MNYSKMKLKHCLLFILLLSSGLSHAQLSLGVIGGVNTIKFKGDKPKNGYYKSSLGLEFGLLIDLKLSDHVIMSLQPSYSQKGLKISFSVPDENEVVDSIRIRFDYIGIPLLFKIDANNKRFYALGGVEAGFPVNAYAEYINQPGEKEDLCSIVSKINVVMHFGVGYRIPIKKSTLSIEGRYLQGLNNVIDEENPNYSYIPRVKTGGLKFLVSYEIPLFGR